jgi:phosphoribosyl-ATP pyrophosphohydrolase
MPDPPRESMKTFDALFQELAAKVAAGDPGSGTVAAVAAGPHTIGKKLVEEAAESWMAAIHEGPERTAEELSQLLYHVQTMMLACGLGLEDVYEYL